MNQEPSQVKADAQAGSPGEASSVGPAVGGVHSSQEWAWFDLWGLSPEYRTWQQDRRRDSARSQACQRGEGRGDGSASAEIATPEKVRKLQRALYRKAKAEPKYRFWSLYGDIMRHRMTECNAMKRPGKPDTGNPSVRFDEERSGSAELTTTVGSIRLPPLRLLYRGGVIYCSGRHLAVASGDYGIDEGYNQAHEFGGCQKVLRGPVSG
jgi:hypothetical protein